MDSKSILEELDWEKMGGLIPTIAQDSQSSEVLMLTYMNKEALKLTLESGYAHYFSRSKNRIWKKGEESGNTQKVDEIFWDCDNDTILLKVTQKGAACHTGEKSCFFRSLNTTPAQSTKPSKPNYHIIDELYHTIIDRKLNGDPKNSYVAKLFASGQNALLKKLSEEAAEFALASKDLSLSKELGSKQFGEHRAGDPQYDVVYEASDLIFHILVTLAGHNIHPSQIYDELKRREGVSGIEEKRQRKS